MAPIFASPDIAALVAAFPPPSPIKNHPSLVRSYSGNNLLNSQKVLARFRVLLETSSTRIKRADLPRRLGIDKHDWLFKCYDGPLRLSKDTGSIIPLPEYDSIFDKLRSEARDNFVELSWFATREDVALESLDNSNAEQHTPALQRISTGPNDDNVVLGTQDLVDRTKRRIMLATSGATVDRVNLSNLLPDISKAMLGILALEATDHFADGNGHIEDDGIAIAFLPSSYSALRESERKEARESYVQRLVQQLDVNGYCIIDHKTTKTLDLEPEAAEQLQLEVLFRYEALGKGGDLTTINTRIAQAPAIVVVVKQKLGEAVQELQDAVDKFFATSSESDDCSNTFDRAFQEALIEDSAQAELASIILNSTERKAVESHFDLAVTKAEAAERDRFNEMIEETVVGPLHLYGAGLATIGDATLKQHQEEYLGEHFRRELVPRFVDSARQQRLIRKKTRARNTEKLAQSCTQTKTFSDIQSVLTKFARKQKLNAPSPSRLADLKRAILEQRVEEMRKMTRGSDLLQNLIWILLAQNSDGLFVSSGKDTSRMVKLYKSIGEEGLASKLEGWRDLLKVGKDSGEDLEEMRELAMQNVEGMAQTK